MIIQKNTDRLLALDGLRGLAIVSVVIHHGCYLAQTSIWKTTWNWVVGLGGLGGNLFMMLSGFLVTASLLKRSGTGTWRKILARHYINRFFRIYPFYFLSLIVICLVLPFLYEFVLGKEDRYLRPSVANFFLYASLLTNIKVASQQFSHPFDVTWTIGTLEQVYLVWIPLCLFISGRSLVGVAIFGIVATSYARLIAARFQVPYHVFHVLPCFRADAILIGGLVAIGVQSRRLPIGIPLLNLLTIVASLAFVLAMFFFSDQGPLWRLRYCYPAMNIVCLLWLLTSLGCSSSTVLTSGLQNSVLRSLAERSYLIYLFHMPVYSILFPVCRILAGRPSLDSAFCDAVSVTAGVLNVPVSFGVAVLIRYVAERPLERWREKLRTESTEAVPAPDSAKMTAHQSVVDHTPARDAEKI